MSTALNRRTFLGSLGLSGAVLLAGWPAAQPLGAKEPLLSGTGHVDDMWGHWPPYAHPIPHGALKEEVQPWERLDPVDRMWGAGL